MSESRAKTRPARSVPDLNRQRRIAVELRLSGSYGLRHIGKASNLSINTVRAAWNAYLEGGWDAVDAAKGGRPDGSGRRLSVEQEAWVASAVLGSPDTVGLSARTWSVDALHELLKQQFGVHLPRTTFLDYLKRWNLEFQPPWVSMHTDEAFHRIAWFEEKHPALEDEARSVSATILWASKVTHKRSPIAPPMTREFIAAYKAHAHQASRSWTTIYSMTSKQKAYWLSCPGLPTDNALREYFLALTESINGKIFLIADSGEFGRTMRRWKRLLDLPGDVQVIDLADLTLLDD